MRSAAFDRASFAFLAVALALTAARIYALWLTPIDLYFDEAQYWTWSQSLEWGYFTKPPMVAWVIAATTSLFGDAEWAIRLAAPLAHAVTATALYALGRSMYGAWPGFWAGFGWLIIPGVWFSSNIISTDALLLPFWSLALLAAWRLLATRAWFWALALGVCIGLGLLAKYAMLYFFLCGALAAWRVKPFREALKGGRGLIAVLIALMIFAPNVIWNYQNGFVTAAHTAENLDVNPTNLFNLDELVEFIGGQALLIGPLLFFALVWLVLRAAGRSEGMRDEDRFLLAFILPVLIIVLTIAFVTRANANWAVVSYAGGLVWLAGILWRGRAGKSYLAVASALNVVIGAIAVVGAFSPEMSNQFKNIRNARGWQETALEIARRAGPQEDGTPFTAVMVDDRATYYALAYYWRDLRSADAPLPPVRMWLLHGEPRNAAEADDPMRAEEGAQVLVVHLSEDYRRFVTEDFASYAEGENLSIPLGGGQTRDLSIGVGTGFDPAPRDAEFRRLLLELQGRR